MIIRSMILVAVTLLTLQAQAAITLPSFFGDHMVLQRDASVAIWGNADAGQTITVSFAGQTVSTRANADGKWRIDLKPLAASSDPDSLTIKSDGTNDTRTIHDVLVGDVWVGSGQSNMAGRVGSYAKNDETLAALVQKAPFARIRLMQGGPKPFWVTATTQAVNQFSAFHFAFGECLHRELNVPIGLIVGAVGVDQHTMMSELIRGWREAWGQGEFPFLFVQKPSGGGCAFTIDDPITRNANPFVAGLPDISQVRSGEQRFLYVRLMWDNRNAWMVPASDLGSGIHPSNKWGYGNRAAQVALSQVYETDPHAYGPTYRSHKIDGSRVTVEFDHVGRGLIAAHNSKLQGFAVAGDDGHWHGADATIDGDVVVLSSKDVPKPTGIRYAFAQNRPWANLFNKDGLPALSFEAGE